MHLDKELKDVGPKYVEAVPYLHLGIAYHKAGQFKEADEIFNSGLISNNNISELHYYKALNLISMDNKKEAKISLRSAQEWFSKGASISRPYVEEFYAIYQEDLTRLMKNI